MDTSSPRPTEGVLWAPPPGALPRTGTQPGDVLRGLSRIKRTRGLYGPDHPVTRQAVREVHGVVERALAVQRPLRLSVYEDTFFVGNTVLLEESLRLSRLLADLREREIGVIELREGVEAWEVERLAEVLQMPAAEVRREAGAAWLRAQGVARVTVGAPPRERPALRVDPRDAYRSGLRAVDDLNYQSSRRSPPDLQKTMLVVKSLADVIAENKFAMMGLTALKDYDEDTCHHSVNVGILSLLMGSRLQLSRSLMAALGLSALLHDVGKMLVPSELLTKPSALTPEEQDTVRRHTVYGARLTRSFPGVNRLAMVVAFEHHAGYDLSGYPRVAVRPAPHLFTRIVQLADFFDAATSSRRLYRHPMLPAEAIWHILDGAGTAFDPILARVFVQLLGLYPVGSLVGLDTGETAVVVRPGEREAARPVVRIVRDADGRTTPPDLVPLEDDRRRIVRVLDPIEAGIDAAAFLDDAGAPPPGGDA